jgi:hypothetical protein
VKVEELPELLGRLQHPGASWEHFSIHDLEDWCRVELCAIVGAVSSLCPIVLLLCSISHSRLTPFLHFSVLPCRRSRPHQSAIAILYLHHETGAMLDLVIDSFDSDGAQHSNAALRLRKGDIHFKSALRMSATRSRLEYDLTPPPCSLAAPHPQK